MNMEKGKCLACSADTNRGIFCHECDKREMLVEFFKCKWNKDEQEAANVIRFIDGKGPLQVLERCRGMERPPRLIMSLCERAVMLGISITGWERMQRKIQAWTKMEPVNVNVTEAAKVTPKREARETEASLGMEEPEYVLGLGETRLIQ